MAGLLAWAADVVGGTSQNHDEHGSGIPVLTAEQQKYAHDLEEKATSLGREIQDLRLRIPSQDISKSLPHLHAHSLASSEALAFQLDAHSTTRQQVQLREESLLEGNTAYEKAISACQKKIQEKLQEANTLGTMLKDLDSTERDLKLEMETLQSSYSSNKNLISSRNNERPGEVHGEEPCKSVLVSQIDEKKKEMLTLEEFLQNLENTREQLQDEFSKRPSSAQREKMLEKQLHSLIEQLTVKQAQVEGLTSEIRDKEMELENLRGPSRNTEERTGEGSALRSRMGRNGSGFDSDYYGMAGRHKLTGSGRAGMVERFVPLRPLFVLYILILHVIVFIKISF